MEFKIPRSHRPLYQEYLTIGHVLHDNYVYEMTEQEFVHQCVLRSGGSINPNKIRDIYNRLMEEAGL